MFDDHTIALERPRFDTPRAWFQARCSCGWKTMPKYTRMGVQTSARNHLKLVRDDALKADLLAAYDRGDKIRTSEWYAAHPLPEAVL